ncbi:hypothetical protein EG328_005207 [Venturia inaequalis]|uniref:Major facilitator superfamily (MFS) profile domain-containing protein n=1 Tax=Venturia inaequalis TaxID=5025 RepID=A0A8H3VWB1_VENIN|nr:hypothetical protein EG328_005207 [Venturia inaequalis]KAE9994068.1 hypothetical protein EG327_001466 [Venturia inaequalis]RDI80969.1 hypothetical protein Vi05172_g9049 [Venturia inaequalis]
MGKIFVAPKEWAVVRDMTARGWRIALFASLGAMVFGYDTAWWSGVLGMPAFTSRYGVYSDVTKKWAISSPLQSSGSGIPTAGRILGSIGCPFVADRFGRRGCFLFISVVYIIAVIIEVTSNSFWQIIIGRFFNYIPMGMAGTLVPFYLAESAPASCRGSMITVFTWTCDAGAMIAAGIVFATHGRSDPGAYKIVMGVQLLFPVLLLAALPFIPETPRYLCMKGRRAEAVTVLKTLRTSDEIAELEILDIEASLEMHTDDGKWIDLFKGTNLRRTIISVTLPTIESWQGQSFMGNYLVVFLIALGQTNQYLLALLLQAVIIIMVTLTFWAPDKIGRRPMLLTGSIVMFVSMFIVAGVSGHNTAHTSTVRKQIAVGFLFIWAITYACTWQTLAFIAPAEIPTQKLRSKTGGLSYFSQQSGGLIITFVSPYMQNAGYGNMGPYIGFFFGAFSFIGIVFVYFCYPETKGASVEELDMYFEQKIATSQFGKQIRGQHAIQEYVNDGQDSTKDIEEGDDSKVTSKIDVKSEESIRTL